MQTNMALIPYEENNSNDGRINPFCRAVYESVNDSGVRCYYEDEKMTKSAYIPAGTQLEYTCPGLLFGVKSEPPVPDIIPLFQSVKAKEFENRCKPFDLARYVAENVQLKHCNGRMYIWNNGCYHLMTEFDTENLIMQYCTEVIYRIGSPGIVKQVANALSLIPKIQCRDDEVNADLIPFQNGFLDISRMVFLPPQPDIFITHSLTVDFQQGNFNCPRFMGFLDTATGGDISLKMRILEIIGYLLSSHNDAKKFFVFIGVGDSGKSLLANLIVSFFTKESIFSAKMNDFGQRFTMGYMNGSQLCVFADMPNTLISANAVGNIKAITGGDTLFGERKNSSPELLRKTTRLLFSTNHEIRTAEPDKQFMDRCCIVPFMVSVPTEQQNPMLLSEMTMERSAIANLAIDAYVRMRMRCMGKGVKFTGEEIANKLYDQYCRSFYTESEFSSGELFSK